LADVVKVGDQGVVAAERRPPGPPPRVLLSAQAKRVLDDAVANREQLRPLSGKQLVRGDARQRNLVRQQLVRRLAA